MIYTVLLYYIQYAIYYTIYYTIILHYIVHGARLTHILSVPSRAPSLGGPTSYYSKSY